MRIENKHCTSDYWAEDKSAWFDRSLVPASQPLPLPLSLYSVLFPPPPVLLPASPSPLLNILPVLFSLLYFTSHHPSLHLFLLNPSLTLIPHILPCSLPFWSATAASPYLSHSCLFPHLLVQLWSIKVCWFKTLGKYWSGQRGGRARSPGPTQERPLSISKRAQLRLLSPPFPLSFFSPLSLSVDYWRNLYNLITLLFHI